MDLDDIGFGEDEGHISKENDSKSGHHPTNESDQSNKKKKNSGDWHGSAANGTGKRVVSLHLPNSGVQSVTVDDPVDGDISVDNVGQHSSDASQWAVVSFFCW